MRWVPAFVLLAGLTLPSPGLGAPVPECPTFDVDEDRALQCATIPGAMSSTYQATAEGFEWELHAVGAPTGTFTVAFANGARLFTCSFVLGEDDCSYVGWLGWAENTLTGTLTLTDGGGAAVVVWHFDEVQT